MIAILMCTYNGGQYLAEQLDSIITQSHSNWTLYLSDDGSTDNTNAIISQYQPILGGKLILLDGPRQGFAANFMSLIRNPAVSGDYFAFCDQDDIWLQDKLARSLSLLRGMRTETAQLYCSRTLLVDGDNQEIGHSPLFAKPPSFPNALVQSLAGANTMLINAAARRLLARTPSDAEVVAHDWLTYLLVTGCGGTVYYDTAPTLRYRQHGGNLIGANASLRDRLSRLSKMVGGRFTRWNDLNLIILKAFDTLMPSAQRQQLRDFMAARDEGGALQRLRALNKAGVYRQTLSGQISLWFAVALRKM